jgi:hypothetical protein
MENFFYIVIGLVWVAYSIYSAKQKALQKQQSSGLPPRGPSQSSPLPIPGNQSGGKSVFEDIFRELTAEPKPILQEKAPVSAPKPVKSTNVSELNVSYEGFSGYKFISGVTQDSSPSIHAESVFPVQSSNNEQITKRFDLREAVIFSELLNRKYF